MSRRLVVALALAALASLMFGLSLAGCGGTRIDSVWLDKPITVDGQNRDWEDIDGYSLKDDAVSFKAANDDTSLYLMASTTDRMLAMQALRRGFSVRMKPENGGDSLLWVGLPKSETVSSPEALGDWRSGEGRGGPEGRERGEGGNDPVGDRRERGDQFLKLALKDEVGDVVIYDDSGDHDFLLAAADAERQGIEMRAGVGPGGAFVIEMRVPLRSDADHPRSVGVTDAKHNVVDVTLRIPKPEGRPERFSGGRREDAAGLMQGPGPGGFGGDGFGGGGFGGRRGFGRRPGMQMPEGLDVTLKLALSMR